MPTCVQVPNTLGMRAHDAAHQHPCVYACLHVYIYVCTASNTVLWRPAELHACAACRRCRSSWGRLLSCYDSAVAVRPHVHFLSLFQPSWSFMYVNAGSCSRGEAKRGKGSNDCCMQDVSQASQAAMQCACPCDTVHAPLRPPTCTRNIGTRRFPGLPV